MLCGRRAPGDHRSAPSAADRNQTATDADRLA